MEQNENTACSFERQRLTEFNEMQYNSRLMFLYQAAVAQIYIALRPSIHNWE